MALSVEELARNVPPTATMYGEFKSLTHVLTGVSVILHGMACVDQ